MRQLTVRQKKVLDKWIEENNPPQFVDWDDLPIQLREQLERINNTEILWMETQRYISDEVSKKMYG